MTSSKRGCAIARRMFGRRDKTGLGGTKNTPDRATLVKLLKDRCSVAQGFCLVLLILSLVGAAASIVRFGRAVADSQPGAADGQGAQAPLVERLYLAGEGYQDDTLLKGELFEDIIRGSATASRGAYSSGAADQSDAAAGDDRDFGANASVVPDAAGRAEQDAGADVSAGLDATAGSVAGSSEAADAQPGASGAAGSGDAALGGDSTHVSEEPLGSTWVESDELITNDSALIARFVRDVSSALLLVAISWVGARFFRRIAKTGEPFRPERARELFLVADLLVALAIAPGLLEAGALWLGVTLLPTVSYDITYGILNYGLLIGAFLLLAFARVFSYGCLLQQQDDELV